MLTSRIFKQAQIARPFGRWSHVKEVAVDPILGFNEKFKTCKDPRKVNMTVGTYKDENGQPWILPSVRQAIDTVYQNRKEIEYNPIIGDREFVGVD